jgi:hypothetical protein
VLHLRIGDQGEFQLQLTSFPTDHALVLLITIKVHLRAATVRSKACRRCYRILDDAGRRLTCLRRRGDQARTIEWIWSAAAAYLTPYSEWVWLREVELAGDAAAYLMMQQTSPVPQAKRRTSANRVDIPCGWFLWICISVLPNSQTLRRARWRTFLHTKTCSCARFLWRWVVARPTWMGCWSDRKSVQNDFSGELSEFCWRKEVFYAPKSFGWLPNTGFGRKLPRRCS